jgi:uncharacterized protein (DUF4415 family)
MKKLVENSEDRELQALIQMRDEDIDTSEISSTTDWSKAVRGKFYRPLKEPVTLRLDADVVAWLKSEGPGYQTRINALLRHCMMGSASPLRSEEVKAKHFGLQFPTLERRGELDRYSNVARRISTQHCFFPVAA